MHAYMDEITDAPQPNPSPQSGTLSAVRMARDVVHVPDGHWQDPAQAGQARMGSVTFRKSHDKGKRGGRTVDEETESRYTHPTAAWHGAEWLRVRASLSHPALSAQKTAAQHLA